MNWYNRGKSFPLGNWSKRVNDRLTWLDDFRPIITINTFQLNKNCQVCLALSKDHKEAEKQRFRQDGAQHRRGNARREKESKSG